MRDLLKFSPADNGQITGLHQKGHRLMQVLPSPNAYTNTQKKEEPKRLLGGNGYMHGQTTRIWCTHSGTSFSKCIHKHSEKRGAKTAPRRQWIYAWANNKDLVYTFGGRRPE